MGNVLDLTPRLSERPPIDVDLPLEIMQRLFTVNKISRHSLFIGAMVLSRFQEGGEYACSLTRQDLLQTHVLIDGEPYSGSANCEIEQLAHALYGLQACCGIHNHIKQNRVGKSTDRYNHFSQPARGPMTDTELHAVIKGDTPIYFCWKPEDADELVADVKEAIEHGLTIAKFCNITTYNLRK